jgi:hypothetical protein
VSEKTCWETIEVKGHELLGKVEELITKGNVRRIRIRQKDRTIAEFPLTIGVVGVILAPLLAAIGAIAALVNDCSIDIQKTADVEADQPAPAN